MPADPSFTDAVGAVTFPAAILSVAVLIASITSCDDAGMRTVLLGAALWQGLASNGHAPDSLIPDPWILVEDGRIVEIASRRERATPPNVPSLDYSAYLLAPAFLDVHIHGSAGQDVMQADQAGMETISRFLANHGTGRFLATTVTAPLETTLRALDRMARMIRPNTDWPGAVPCGIHLEGPFLSHAKRGVHPEQDLLEPSVAIFDRLLEAADGHVRLMTLAPELPGAFELAAHACARGVRVSMGHSNATAQQAQQLMLSGATTATHTFNAMRTLDHREPGIAGFVLTEDALYAELICDGIHVDPRMVRLWWRQKGIHRGILVTDAMAATGMPDGSYQLGGLTVELAAGRATANGVLAGSVLTLDRALENLMHYAGVELPEALPLLTQNPARMLGMDPYTEPGARQENMRSPEKPGKDILYGGLVVGSRADLVALDATGRLVASISAGRLA